VQNKSDVQPWMLEVVAYSSWKDRSNLMMLSKRTWINSNSEAFYRFLCERVSFEYFIYIPAVLPSSDSWKSLFKECYKIRDLWKIKVASSNLNTLQEHQGDEKIEQERFKISVYARFRPFIEENKKLVFNDVETDETELDNNMEVTLPLHQRLAMIRMSHGLQNNQQALKILASEGGWFKKKWTTLSEDTNNKENSNPNSDFYYVKKQNKKKVVDVGLREFSFDRVFSYNATQSTVYDGVSRKLLSFFYLFILFFRF
jgi:hypothetical protein